MENVKFFILESGIKIFVYYGNIDLLEKVEVKGI